MKRIRMIGLCLVATFAVSATAAASASAKCCGALAWGDNESGQLGTGATTEHSNVVPLAVSGLSSVGEVAAGSEHSLALLRNGTVAAWGLNRWGQLGDGTDTGPETCMDENPCSKTPVAVSGLSGVRAISAGPNFNLALLKTGTVMAWGDDSDLQLGGDAEKCGGGFCSPTPVAVRGLRHVTEVATGTEHSLALLKNGTVMAWGSNNYGELGNGTREASEVPVVVSGLGEVTAIAGGEEFSLALLRNGTVMAWGLNDHGQLGDGTNTGPEACPNCSTTPVAVSGLSGVTAIAARQFHSLALLINGTVMSWGASDAGELGDDTPPGPETCVEPFGSSFCGKTPVAVNGLTDVRSIAAGGNFSLALQTDGTVLGWGENSYGELGDGTDVGPEHCETSSFSYTICSKTPVVVNGAPGVKGIAAGGWHSLAYGTRARPSQR
jgi:alpha-tubulin suppressor-like RCC1 family protein